jgi:hypothetical protein
MPLIGNPTGAPNFWSLWGSTQYAESADEQNPSPDLGFAIDSGRVVRQLWIGGEAAAWQTAKSDFLGFGQVLTGLNGVRYISRQIPHAFPLANWLYAQGTPKFEMVQLARVNMDVAEYTMSKMTVNYLALSYNIQPDANVLNTIVDVNNHFLGYPDEGFALSLGFDTSRYVTHNRKPSSKFLSLARGSMYVLASDIGQNQPRPLAEGLPFKEPAAEVQFVWHVVPEAGVPDVLHMVAHGCINDDWFMGYPPQTLRIEGIEPINRRDPLGNRVVDVVYRMQFLPRVGKHIVTGAQPVNGPPQLTFSSIQPHGHNWVWATALGNLVLARVTTDGTPNGDPPYQTLDFKLLFNPDQP